MKNENVKVLLIVLISLVFGGACYYAGQKSLSKSLSKGRFNLESIDTAYTKTDTIISINLKAK